MSNWEMMKKIYNEEGIDGFYKGIIPSLVLTLNPVIQFSLYEIMKDSFARSSTGLKTKHIAYISFISKFVTTVITYPLMTIKTMIQADDKKNSDEVLQYLYSIIKTEGLVNGYYKGISINLLKVSVPRYYKQC
jgi:hypothetical protein